MNYIIRAEAVTDASAIAMFISRDNIAAAKDFLNSIHASCKNISRFPEIGKKKSYKNHLLKDVRVLPVHKFQNYLIFYRFLDKNIEVIRILDGRRDLPSLFL